MRLAAKESRILARLAAASSGREVRRAEHQLDRLQQRAVKRVLGMYTMEEGQRVPMAVDYTHQYQRIRAQYELRRGGEAP